MLEAVTGWSFDDANIGTMTAEEWEGQRCTIGTEGMRHSVKEAQAAITLGSVRARDAMREMRRSANGLG